jgi:hypothetical protein
MRYLTNEREIFGPMSQRELDANTEAVSILMAAKAIPEADAVRQIHAWLWRLHVTKWPVARFHLPWCQEIDDLMRRFPRVALRSCEPAVVERQP